MKKNKLLVSIVAVLLLIAMLPLNVFAASYDDVDVVFSGYSVSMSTKHDYSIVTNTVSKLINTKSYAVSTTDTYTTTRSITFSSGCSSSISGSISATSGTVTGKLGAAIEAEYSFADNYVRTYTKSITATVPANSTYTVKVTIKGDKVQIYYKNFLVWITTEKGEGVVYVPKYCAWTCA